MCFLRINKEESRITIPFNIYTHAIIKANVPAPNPALSNIEANVAIVKKIMGVSSKNMKPATILFFKLCPDKEMAKKFRMLNSAIAKSRTINTWMPSDILPLLL